MIARRSCRWRPLLLGIVAALLVGVVAAVPLARAEPGLYQTIPTRTPRNTIPPAPSATPPPPATPPTPPGTPPEPTNTPGPGPTAPPPGPTATKEPAVRAPASGDLIVELSVSRQDVLPGEVIQYTVQVANSSALPATGLVLRDSLDPLLDPYRVSATAGSVEFRGQVLYLSLGALEPGETALVLIEARVARAATRGQVILNQVELLYDTGRSDSAQVAIALPPAHLPATGAGRRHP